MILKLGMKHQGMELYKVYINHAPDLFYGNVNLSHLSQISGERLQDHWSSQALVVVSLQLFAFCFCRNVYGVILNVSCDFHPNRFPC